MQDNLVFSNLFHRPARTFVSVFGIAVGVLLILFTIGLANGTLRESAQREANINAEIVFRASGTLGFTGQEPFRVPLSRVAELRQIEGVKAAIPVGQNFVAAKDTNFGSRLADGINFDEYSDVTGIKIVKGEKLGAGGEIAIVDSAFAANKKLVVGSKMTMYEREFTIVGIFEPVVSARVKMPLATMQEKVGADDKCTSVLIKLNNPAEQSVVMERIKTQFPEDQVFFTKDFEEIYSSAVPSLNVFLNVVIGVAAVVSALIILLTMYTTVTERTRQIGVLKSLGMSKTGIAWTITQEALLLSFFGVVLGVLLTLGLRFVLMSTTTMHVTIDPLLLVQTLVIGLIGGALGALYPAIRAARLDAVDALSYE